MVTKVNSHKVVNPFVLLMSGDWKEDSAHENGEYQNRCCFCGETFIGYKRRVVCKVCSKENKD